MSIRSDRSAGCLPISTGLVALFVALSVPAHGAPSPINTLTLKGTHNSYVCDGECGLFTCDLSGPHMSHPPYEQIDNFGVVAIELDWGIALGQSRPQVGHDGPGHGTCWGLFLEDFLRDIKDNCRALAYRPLLVYAEPKSWTSSGMPPEEAALSVAESVFGADNVMTTGEMTDLVNSLGRFPTVPELAGKVLWFGWLDSRWQADFRDECTDLSDVLASVDAGHAIMRLDQYITDWTFEYACPPNPLVVVATAPETFTVVGHQSWSGTCPNGDQASGNLVGQQGTYLLPFSRIGRAVERARGILRGGNRDARTGGTGWTITIAPGTYVEGHQVIDIPLLLERDPQSNGTVVLR